MHVVTYTKWAVERGSHLAGVASDVEPLLCRSHNPGWRGQLPIGCRSARSSTSSAQTRTHYWCRREPSVSVTVARLPVASENSEAPGPDDGPRQALSGHVSARGESSAR
jgi:hypothetical protein